MILLVGMVLAVCVFLPLCLVGIPHEWGQEMERMWGE